MGRVFAVKALVIILGRVKIAQGQNWGDHRSTEATGLFQRPFGSFGQALLGRIVIKDGGTILRTPIHELPAGIGGVDGAPENLQ